MRVGASALTLRSEHPFVRLTPIEEQFAFPFEPRPDRQSFATLDTGCGTAREALEDILLVALQGGRCYVTFSGGRDSSALLAVATHVARREGLPLPVPVTAIYPTAPASEESSWQELVLNHLCIRERLVIEITHQQRLLSKVATDAIRRHGLVWPEAAQLQGALLEQLEPGASVVNGEGGDNVIVGGRAGPLHKLCHTWPPRRRLLLASGRVLVPTRHRSRPPPFYTPTAAETFGRISAWKDPLRWNTRTRNARSTPAAQVLFANVEASIAEFGLRPVTPYVHPAFLASLAQEGGWLGFGSRGRVFRHLVGDLLPHQLLFRTSKASFNETRWGDSERQFASTWTGSGVDPTIIDVEKLRADWLTDEPHPQSDFLLHVAWAAQADAPQAMEQVA
jgi:hypothetical protein